jgi:DNA-binding transcriptional LysR family regulator
MDWDKLRVFHAVAEAGSFTHAGETLNLSQSAVSRQISALEESLSVPLFHRHARGLILTEQGELLFRTAREVFAKLSMAEGMISESKDRPRGPLKITTTVAFGSVWLTPRIREFLELYPEIQVSVVVDDSELDLSMREADVAIRMSPPRQPDLIQRHLVSIQVHVYAAPEYIKKYGMPQKPEDLDKHRIILYGEDSRPPATGVNWLLDAGAKANIDRYPAGSEERARDRGALGFHRHRAPGPRARLAGADGAAGRSLFRISGGVAELEENQRLPRLSAAQGGREPIELNRVLTNLTRALRFLQTSYEESRGVLHRRNAYIGTCDR